MEELLVCLFAYGSTGRAGAMGVSRRQFLYQPLTRLQEQAEGFRAGERPHAQADLVAAFIPGGWRRQVAKGIVRVAEAQSAEPGVPFFHGDTHLGERLSRYPDER